MEKEGDKEQRLKSIISDKGYIKWFSELNKTSGLIAGGKGANLGEMFNSNFPIPPGFVVTTKAYTHFIETAGIKNQIEETLDKIDTDRTAELEIKAKQIRELIKSKELPEDLQEEIKEAYEHLSVDKIALENAKGDALNILKRSQEPIFVAVRSSATTEDLSDASFAGQQESYLNVKGNQELLNKIKAVFASLFTARAIYYRKKKGFSKEKFALAAVVQKMIDSDKSGVMFSQNPIKQNNNLIIEAVFGLGEGIVSGKIKPDNYEVSRELEILDKKIADKKIAIVRNSQGETETIKLIEDKSKLQVLSDYEIKKLADYGIKIEEHYKKPQDIEFAIDSGEIYITQSRPITTQAKKSKEKMSGRELLSGLGASPGIGSGKVRIIHDLSELNKIQQGDILVTEMTNPDMVVTMQKSTAIVTNEGGLTCIEGNTNILTDKGFMKIKDIVENQIETKVLSLDRNTLKLEWEKIIASMRRKSNLIEIDVSLTGNMKGNTLKLTPDHKMITLSNRKLIDKEIQNILVDKDSLLIAQRIPSLIESNKFEKDMAYLLGSLSSDGHVTYNNRRGSIILTQKETPEKINFINKVCKIMKEKWGKDCIVHNKISEGKIRGKEVKGEANDYCWYNKQAAIQITQYRNELSEKLLVADNKFIFNYLAGLIDGDGTYNHNSNRINIYCSKKDIIQNIVIGCLRLGIVPQVTINRTIHNVQIVERVEEILAYCKRVKGFFNRKCIGTRLFNARQILGDVVDSYNVNGRIKPYVQNNLLIDSEKIMKRIIPIMSLEHKEETMKLLNSDFRMLRCNLSKSLGEDYVYNLTIENNHNFVVFTDRYTPVILNNCHAAIVSREMGIPAVVGTGNATEVLKDRQLVTVDGFEGKVFEGKGETIKVEVKPIVETRTKIKVIVDLPEAAERAAKSKSDSIGLLRLEGIIALSGKHPDLFVKQKKLSEYTTILEEGISKISELFKEIWVRTSDIRSDEFSNLEGAPKEIEANPMLGMHGIRFSLKNPELMKAELNAIKKCAEKFKDKTFGFMLPQIISVEEIQKTKKIVKEINLQNIKFGIMVETPASCFIIKHLLKEGVDFVSFGTNDLTQYILAIDRGNEQVQYIYDETHPAVLNAIKRVIRTCKEMNVESSICGQAGSNKNMVKFLVENEIDSISVNADAAYEISKYIAELEQGSPQKQPLEELKKPFKELDNHKDINKNHKQTPEEIIKKIEQRAEQEIQKQVQEIQEVQEKTQEQTQKPQQIIKSQQQKLQTPPPYIAGILKLLDDEPDEPEPEEPLPTPPQINSQQQTMKLLFGESNFQMEKIEQEQIEKQETEEDEVLDIF